MRKTDWKSLWKQKQCKLKTCVGEEKEEFDKERVNT